MSSTSISTRLAALAFAVALVAFLYLCFADTYAGTSYSGGTIEHTSSTMIEENGAGVLGVLALPVGLAAIGLLFSIGRSWVGTVGLWVTAIALLGFCFVGMLSIGVFYAPAALLLIAAAIAHRRESSRRLVSQEN